MPHISIGDADIHYTDQGNGSPVLLVAGLGGAGNYWDPQIASFSAWHRTIIHDHRGTGKSTFSRIDYNVGQMTDDLVRFMDVLKIERAHLVGHSTGGAMGQVLAIDHPDRVHGLVLFSSWTKSDPFMRRSLETRRLLATEAGPEAYIAANPIFLQPSWWVNENAEMLVAKESASAASLPPAEISASRIDGILQFDRRADLGRITAPTMVICAKDDYLTPFHYSEELARSIPGAKLVELPRGGHAASQTVRAEFDAPVLDFLAALDSGGKY